MRQEKVIPADFSRQRRLLICSLWPSSVASEGEKVTAGPCTPSRRSVRRLTGAAGKATRTCAAEGPSTRGAASLKPFTTRGGTSATRRIRPTFGQGQSGKGCTSLAGSRVASSFNCYERPPSG